MPTPYDKLVDKLTELESSDSTSSAAYLNDVRSMLALLLQSGRDDSEIRQQLSSQMQDGLLQTETLDLVSTMLDGMTTENIPTTPQAANVDDAGFDVIFGGDDDYAATAVIGPLDDIKKERDQELQVGSILRDRFLLKEKVAGGSMGVVFKALDRRLAETDEVSPFVAIKVLSPQFADEPKALRALQQEAAKGRFLSHPNIVRFIDLDRDDDMYFIVMEWLDGENLADILDNTDRIDPKRALEILRQLGSALEYAHNRGIVHADVKPANVMILPNGDAKLFDFGVARIRQQQDETSPGFNPRILGALTPAYSSMQVLTGDEPVPQDDVFSLACLFYRLIAGHRVFGPRNAAEAAEEGMSPQPLPGLSEPQWKAVKKALSFSRVTRFSDVREFLTALDPPSETQVFTADRTTRFMVDEEIETQPKKTLWYVVLLILIGGLSAFLLGAFDPWLHPDPPRVTGLAGVTEDESSTAAVRGGGVDDNQAVAEPVSDGNENKAARQDSPVQPQPGFPEAETSENIDDAVSEAEPEPVGRQQNAGAEPETETASSVFPNGDVSIRLDGSSQTIILRENTERVLVDLLRVNGNQRALQLDYRVADFTGNRSPLSSNELTIEKRDGLLVPTNENRAQLILQMTADPVREADQQLVLEVFEVGNPETVLSVLRLELEDDDQRLFEFNLPADTVAFAVGQASVSESDAAVQVDLVRFKPSQTPLSVEFVVMDVTASAESDYFPPQQTRIEFAPGERSARVLIPLVQDAAREGNEAFILELLEPNQLADPDLYRRIVVMIRDDD